MNFSFSLILCLTVRECSILIFFAFLWQSNTSFSACIYPSVCLSLSKLLCMAFTMRLCLSFSLKCFLQSSGSLSSIESLFTCYDNCLFLTLIVFLLSSLFFNSNFLSSRQVVVIVVAGVIIVSVVFPAMTFICVFYHLMFFLIRFLSLSEAASQSFLPAIAFERQQLLK